MRNFQGLHHQKKHGSGWKFSELPKRRGGFCGVSNVYSNPFNFLSLKLFLSLVGNLHETTQAVNAEAS